MRITSKGQVTIPRDIRRRAGFKPGSAVEFNERRGEVVLVKATERSERRKQASADFAAYLDRVTGIVDLGMTTDEFMLLLRGE